MSNDAMPQRPLTPSGAPDPSALLHYGDKLIDIRKRNQTLFTQAQESHLHRKRTTATPIPIRRILAEHHQFQASPLSLPYLTFAPSTPSLLTAHASIEGPPESPYAGGIFWLHIRYPSEYPKCAMQVRFLTPIYHPNVSAEGEICMSILDCDWSPILSTRTVLLSVLSRLDDPELEEPVRGDAARRYREDYPGFWEQARRDTEVYAIGEEPPVGVEVEVEVEEGGDGGEGEELDG
ncbi:ubiquitin-conjugating enzyme E2 13 protein [Rutstroemia sp. NJR-2017a BVV2]|nr:ubiquitin-conjugating enzyme E2 13 protein [Rutstroemia sp. NJR-2017a BVV2]